MKKVLLALLAVVLWAGSSWGQIQYTVVPTGGTAGNTNGTGADPISRYYSSIRYQVVYTVAELTTAGMPANISISRLAWNVTESSVSLGNYTIKMGHTAATNSATHNVDATTTVKNAYTYPVATGYNDIIFDQPFVWNGSSNIVVEICTGPSNPYTSPYGGVQAKTSITNGSRYYQVDGSSACAVNTSSTASTKPYIRFTGTVASGPLNPSAFTATPVSPSQINLGWTPNGNGNPVMLVWNTTNTFGTPVDGTSYAVDATIDGGGTVLQNDANTTFSHGSRTANTTYYYKAFSRDGSTVYSGGVTANATTFCELATQVIEDFEPALFPPTCWSTIAGTGSWARSTAASGYGAGTASSFANFYNINGAVPFDLISPVFDVTATKLSFDHAYATYETENDILRILYSVNGGSSYTQLVQLDGGATGPLNTGGTVSGSFVPSAAEWATKTYDLPEGTNRIKFQAVSAYGNNLYLDNIIISAPIAVDLKLSEFYQNTGLPVLNSNEGHNNSSAVLSEDITGVPDSDVNNSVLIPNSTKVASSITLADIEVNALVENIGLDAASYILNWDVDGVTQTPYTGTAIDPEGTESITLNYTPADRGTFFANGSINVVDDGNTANNSNQFRMRVYPDVYTQTIYDRGVNIVDTWVGWNNATIALKAAVRYTAADYIKPVGVDFICQTEAISTGTYTVELRAAGTTTLAPGAVLFTKNFTNPVYFSAGGAYLHFAFDENEIPTFAPGTDYWIAIQCPLGVLYPGGVHNTGFTTGRSFLYNASTDTWSALVITTERAWIMRSVQVQGEVPACLMPTAQTVSNKSTVGADLGWTSGNSLFDVFVVPSGNPAPNAGTTPTADNVSNPYTWVGGNPNIAYDWYVRTDCEAGGGTGQSEWAGPNTFKTIATAPFFEGFETGNIHNTAIADWTQEAVLGTNIWTANNTLTDYNRTPRTGSWNAFLRYSNTRWMFKAFYLTEGVTYNFAMYARQDGATAANSNITVSYGSAGNAAAMTNSIIPATGIINGNYQLLEGSFTPSSTGIQYIGINGFMNSSPWYISIDDISLTEASTATLSWYNLQWPLNATIDVTQNVTVYAQCWESGVTEPDGPGAGIECWIGYNNADTDPSTWSGTNWVATTYNYASDDPGFNNDEYMANLGATQGLAVGTYYYASRFRYQSGPFTYGGFNGGQWNGTSNISGILTVNPLPNDECSGALPVTCGNSYTGATTNATLDIPGTCNTITVTAPGVWYKFTGNDNWIEADLCSAVTNYDSKLSVYSGSCGALVCVTADDDGCDTPSNASKVKWLALSGTDYYILVHGYNANKGNFELTINCITPPTAANWDGSESTDWFNALNWDTDVPAPSTNVNIPAGLTRYPTLTAAAFCNNFTLASGGSFIGSEFLTVNGTITIERTIDAYTSGTSGWHLISSPVAAQSISGDWTPGTGYDFYVLDESNASYWLNQKNHPEFTSFIPGTGYLVAYQNTATKTFTGAMNAGPVTKSGLTSTAGDFAGWHLVGNPFTSAINYSTGTWTKTNLDAEMQVWSSADASYKTSTEVGGIVPAMNGFMVHTSGSGELTIPLNSRVHNAASWYKSTEDFILLKANDPANQSSQSSLIRFNSGATANFDSEFDSYYLAGFAPMFYSKSNGESFALNTMPQLTNETVIPFDFIKNGSSEFNIELAKTIPAAILYLTDKKTNIVTNLSQTPVYSFTAVEGDVADRFLLTFGSVGIDNPDASRISIYGSHDVIFIKGANAGSEVKITNLLGQELIRTTANGNGVSTINAGNLSDGIYLVSVISGNSVVSKKVVLEK